MERFKEDDTSFQESEKAQISKEDLFVCLDKISQAGESAMDSLINLLDMSEQYRPARIFSQFEKGRKIVSYYDSVDRLEYLETVIKIFQLFEELQPRNQLDRLMFLTHMPKISQPSNQLTLAERKKAIVTYFHEHRLFDKLIYNLEYLIRKQ